MKLEEFIKQQKEELDKWEQDWKKERAEYPNAWPLEMPEEEWLEQYITYLTI